MKILLIHTPTLEIDNFVPPLGILYLASVLKKEECEVKIIDKDPEYFDIASEARKFNPDMIGLSFMTPSYGKVHSLCKVLKKEFPNSMLFSGGVHTSVMPERMIKELGLDFAVVGEAETTVAEVVRSIKNRKSLKGIKGVAFKEGNKVVNNGPRGLVQDLDKLPFPDRSLLNFKKEYLVYPGVIRGHACKSTTVMSTRGCPYHCTYCGSKLLFGTRVRYRSVKNLVAELQHLIKKYDLEGIWFADDTFTVNPKRVIDFCKMLKRNKIRLVWACQARVNTVSDEVLKEMKNAGCVQMDFGVESGSEKILKILKKDTNIPMIKKAFKLAKKHKIRTLATFMVNNPFETREDIEQTFKLAKDISADFTTFFYTTPFPGTELYSLAESQGWLDENKDYSEKWNVRTAQLPVMNNDSGLTKDEIMKIRSRMQNHFFVRNYVRMSNIILGFHMSYKFLKKPKVIVEGLKKVMKTGKMDQAFEVMFAKSKID